MFAHPVRIVLLTATVLVAAGCPDDSKNAPPPSPQPAAPAAQPHGGIPGHDQRGSGHENMPHNDGAMDNK